MVVGQLAAVAGIPWNPRPLKPQRGKKKTQHREIPTDQQIFEFWKEVNATRPDWGWVIGMQSTYGLRNHEVFFTRFSDRVAGAIEVTQGKTGERVAFPLYPEWVSRFELTKPKIPPIQLDRENENIGHSVTEFFCRVGVKFRPYDLRHAWAIRAHLVYRLSDVVAANCMGHSVDVHRKIYLKWITLSQTQAEIESAMGISKPKPEAPL